MSGPCEPSDSDKIRALTAQVHAASANLAALSRELSRSRIVMKLVRSTQQLGVGSAISDDLAFRFLQVVIEQTLCDTAVLLRNRGRPGDFVTVQAIGHTLQSQSEELVLPGIPSFLVLPGGACPSHVTREFHRAYGTGPTLWSLHVESGLALLLYSRPNATIRQDFGETDRELLETALSVYVQLLADRNVNRALAQAKQSAESRLASSRAMMNDLLDLLCTKLDSALGRVLSAKERFAGDGDLEEARCLISEVTELVGLSRDVAGAANIPLNLELSWGKLEKVIAEACAFHRRLALYRGIDIQVLPKPGGVLACFDAGWISEILKKILARVLDEAQPGTSIFVDHARRSDGLISITVRWKSVELVRSGARAGDAVCEVPLSFRELDEVCRLVDAYGGTLICERKDPVSCQIDWTFAPNE